MADADAPGPVGVVGLGAMGLPMARNLVAGGGRVGLTGRHPEKAAALVEAGAAWTTTRARWPPRSTAAASC